MINDPSAVPNKGGSRRYGWIGYAALLALTIIMLVNTGLDFETFWSGFITIIAILAMIAALIGLLAIVIRNVRTRSEEH